MQLTAFSWLRSGCVQLSCGTTPPTAGKVCMRADTPPRAPCQLPRLPDVAFPQKGGALEYGLPSRPVPRSACPQHPRTPLLLSQPSSHPLLRVVQTWVGAALLARQFLVASIRARPQPERRVAMQKQPPANAQSTSIGFAACS